MFTVNVFPLQSGYEGDDPVEAKVKDCYQDDATGSRLQSSLATDLSCVMFFLGILNLIRIVVFV